MLAEFVTLLVLAAAMAGPVTVLLASARWPQASPAAALILWQGIGLSGGMALLTAELTLATSGRHAPWGAAVLDVAVHPYRVQGVGWAGLVAFWLTAIWLIAVLFSSAVRVAAARRRHRTLIDLLAVPVSPSVPDVYVVAHGGTAAYSIPGRQRRIVVSQGVCERLNPAGLQAVVEHERAHLRQHHDVVVQPFVAWQHSFPFLASAAAGRRAVEVLVEFLADDAARAKVGPEPLRTALTALQSDLESVDVRIGRVARERRGLRHIGATVVTATCATLMVVAPPAVLVFAR